MGGRPRCRKCGSSALTVEDCRDGSGQKAIRCLRCGWHLFDPRDGAGMSRPLTAEDFAPAPVRRRKVRWGQCAVLGCPERIDLSQNTSGLCQRHQQQMRSWTTGKRTLPPPLQQMPDGSFVVVREQQVRGAR